VEKMLGPQLEKATEQGNWCGVKPSLAFTIVYLQFFTYFLVETLFRAKQHLGVSEKEAVTQMIRLFTDGCWSGNRKASRTATG
jgi:hypothetical protein